LFRKSIATISVGTAVMAGMLTIADPASAAIPRECGVEFEQKTAYAYCENGYPKKFHVRAHICPPSGNCYWENGNDAKAPKWSRADYFHTSIIVIDAEFKLN
jgi:hypothetical protein